MAAPNIVQVATIKGNTEVLAVTTTAANIVINAASSGKVYKLNMLRIANIDGTNPADITASILRSGTRYHLASTVSVPADATLDVVEKGVSLYLEEGDSIELTASADNDLEAVCSYEEIS